MTADASSPRPRLLLTVEEAADVPRKPQRRLRPGERRGRRWAAVPGGAAKMLLRARNRGPRTGHNGVGTGGHGTQQPRSGIYADDE